MRKPKQAPNPRHRFHWLKPSFISITSQVLFRPCRVLSVLGRKLQGSQLLGLKCPDCQEGYDFLADLDLEMVAELEEWGALKWDHPFGTSSFPCLSLIFTQEVHKAYLHHFRHILLLPDGVILRKLQECLEHKRSEFEDDDFETVLRTVRYEIEEGKFQPSKSQPASIDVSWTGAICCNRVPHQEWFSEWELQPKNENSVNTVEEFCENWRTPGANPGSTRQWISKCCISPCSDNKKPFWYGDRDDAQVFSDT